MKNTLFSLVIFLLLSLGISCKSNNNSTDYLQKVLANLKKIESASYSTLIEKWYPGDTSPKSVYCRLYKEFNNPADTTIGASYVWFFCDSPANLASAYDGKIRASVNPESKKIVVDNFTNYTTRPLLPFRPLSPPFFNYTKNIIQYALTTQDSIILDLKEFDEYYYFKLVINEDKQVEFFGKACYMPENPYITETTSIYELWISKLNNLPYKLQKEMSHDISVRTVSDVEINKLSVSDFNIYNYFPNDYEVEEYGKTRRERKEFNLIGKKAPFWTLNDKDGKNV